MHVKRKSTYTLKVKERELCVIAQLVFATMDYSYMVRTDSNPEKYLVEALDKVDSFVLDHIKDWLDCYRDELGL